MCSFCRTKERIIETGAAAVGAPAHPAPSSVNPSYTACALTKHHLIAIQMCPWQVQPRAALKKGSFPEIAENHPAVLLHCFLPKAVLVIEWL